MVDTQAADTVDVNRELKGNRLDRPQTAERGDRLDIHDRADKLTVQGVYGAPGVAGSPFANTFQSRGDGPLTRNASGDLIFGPANYGLYGGFKPDASMLDMRPLAQSGGFVASDNKSAAAAPSDASKKSELGTDAPTAAPADAQSEKTKNIGTIFNPQASAQEKLSAVEKLHAAGVETFSAADAGGQNEVGRNYSIEKEQVGSRTLLHLYGTDDKGNQHPVLRGIANGDGTFAKERDRRGNAVDYQGSWWQSHMGDRTGTGHADGTTEPGNGSRQSRRPDLRQDRRPNRQESEEQEPQTRADQSRRRAARKPEQGKPSADTIESKYAARQADEQTARKEIHEALADYKTFAGDKPMTKDGIKGVLDVADPGVMNDQSRQRLQVISDNWDRLKQLSVDGKGEAISDASADAGFDKRAQLLAAAKDQELQARVPRPKNATAEATRILSAYDTKLDPIRNVGVEGQAALRDVKRATGADALSAESIEAAVHGHGLSRKSVQRLQNIENKLGSGLTPYTENGEGNRITADSLNAGVKAQEDPIIAQRTAELVRRGLVDANAPSPEIPNPARPLTGPKQIYTSGYYPHNDSMEGGYFDRTSTDGDMHYLQTMQDFLEQRPGLDGKVPQTVTVAGPDWIPDGQKFYIPELDAQYRDQLKAINKDHILFIKNDKVQRQHIDVASRTRNDTYGITRAAKFGDKPWTAYFVRSWDEVDLADK